ncbi:type IV secretory system conjugative DNA transfer family protein [Schaalia sp. JY-X169]|uniref:type IV secretory system conjugative DNA transfer family protein n=1 Tax=Schaalia sp. JY-X169 TaxID=2758572 RepID=UPI0015F3FF09|nr:type IV secretory system conjugative DNA transfer family protein [Schaalia sp. JY-X169]
MSIQGRQSGSFGDEMTNILIAVLIGILGLTLVLRASGSVAAFLTRVSQPSEGIAGGVGVLFDPTHPGRALGSDTLNPFVYWLIVGVMLAVLVLVLMWAWTRWRRHSRKVDTDPRRLPGTATAYEVQATASSRALLRRAATLRPSLERPEPSDVGYRLGQSRGKGVWASVEDSILLIGPPRSGKGLHIVIPAILDAPGAVVTTSTRPDNLTATLRARMRVGPVMVFDPQHLAEGVPAGLRWSPIRGCEDPLTAMIRAAGLAAADAVAILNASPRAATGWSEGLEAMIETDPRTRDSIWQGVSLALAALADPRVLDAVSPGPDEAFDPEAFIREKGTLYLLATGAGAGNSAALVAAFVEDLVETARRMAARSPGARLDPPLLLALDEIGNLAPLPSLPTLMAEGGGTGITTMPVLQSLAQARDKWSEDQAAAIWDSSIAKIILGGASNSRDLQDLSTLIGERDEFTDSVTLGDYGSRSSQRSVRRVPIMPPDRIRTMPFGTGVLLLRSAPPIIVDLLPRPKRSDAASLKRERSEIETLLENRPISE